MRAKRVLKSSTSASTLSLGDIEERVTSGVVRSNSTLFFEGRPVAVVQVDGPVRTTRSILVDRLGSERGGR